MGIQTGSNTDRPLASNILVHTVVCILVYICICIHICIHMYVYIVCMYIHTMYVCILAYLMQRLHNVILLQ